MKTLRVIYTLTAVAFLVALSFVVHGESDSFVIQGADFTKTLVAKESPSLMAELNKIAPRVVVQFANGMRYHSLSMLPEELDNNIDEISPRIVFQFANEARHQRMTYPHVLIGDKSTPIADSPTASQLTSKRVRITWSTNEYASAAVEIGTQSGQYTKTVSDDLFKKQHEITIDNLTPGVTYYFRTNNTDRSGNRSAGTEKTFEVVEKIYQFLPMVRSN